MASKRKAGTLDAFFRPPPAAKSQRLNEHTPPSNTANNTLTPSRTSTIPHDPEPPTPLSPPSTHPHYPHPIPPLPPSTQSTLSDPTLTPPAGKLPRSINDKPHLDLLYYTPFIPRPAQRALFRFLRAELPFYRVRYRIKRGGVESEVNTPRFTTVFGVDGTSYFDRGDPPSAHATLHETATNRPSPRSNYTCNPRPIPGCLETLRVATEKATGCAFNFCLVNYYASGADSISFHADDERFLGAEPGIASFSLGAARDFVLKRKPVGEGAGGSAGAEGKGGAQEKVKLPLNSGDMVLMRGGTQAGWLHSLPKRAGMSEREGRINITFRRALVRAGTENYYQVSLLCEGQGEGCGLLWILEEKN